MNNNIFLLKTVWEWDLQHLFQLFDDQMIDYEVIKMLQPHHITKLFENVPIGEQAKFEFYFGSWKKQFSNIEFSLNTDQNLKQQPTVMEILSNTCNGKEILKFYKTNKALYEEQRNLLICTITKYLEAKGIVCSLSDCSSIENQICHIFPTEKLEFYTNGKRGKIYNKLANCRRHSKSILKLDELEEKQNYSENEENFAYNIDYLRSDQITQNEFDIYWKKCASLRFKQISDCKNTAEIFKMWPEYTKPSGYILIDIDFDLKFPMAKNFHERWSYFASEILFVLKTKISCSLISKNLVQIDQIDEESKVFAMLWYCHNMFPPQLKVSTDENGAKCRKKYSIVDSQEAFAIVAATMEELDTKIKLPQIQGRSIQPKLLIIGDILKIREIYVYFDNIRYPFVSVLHAFDLLFKIFFVFNLQYPDESEIFYSFVQSLFYDLPTNKKYIKASSIKHEILKLKN